MAENPKRGQGPLRAVAPVTSTMSNRMMMVAVVVVNNFRLDIWQMNPSKRQNMDLRLCLLLSHVNFLIKYFETLESVVDIVKKPGPLNLFCRTGNFGKMWSE
jgi:hypothetical protein